MTVKPLSLAVLLLFGLTTIAACSQESTDQPEFDVEQVGPMPTDPAEQQMADFKETDPWKFGQGEAMAENVCSSCHAITLTDARPHADAPAFRDLSISHDLNALGERFQNGIITGHPDMPVFVFEDDQIESLIYYIKSLQLPE